jgi:hypothetical protein
VRRAPDGCGAIGCGAIGCGAISCGAISWAPGATSTGPPVLKPHMGQKIESGGILAPHCPQKYAFASFPSGTSGA